MPNFQVSDSLVTAVLVYVVMCVVALWAAMVFWTFRDMRSRSRDFLAQVIVAVLVTVLTLPGLLIYLFLRPRETLSEAYERSLEEEALLQEIEEKPVCPGCKQRAQADWQACPHCHTRLKKPCVRCSKMLELTWDVCPYCTTTQPNYAAEAAVSESSHVRRATGGETRTARRRSSATTTRSESLEFVDGDESF